MAARKGTAPGSQPDQDASIWIDSNQAVIIRSSAGCPAGVEVLIRLPTESEAHFEGRTADEVLDAEWVKVAGPIERQTGFDRAFVGLTHRPDRLVGSRQLDPIKP